MMRTVQENTSCNNDGSQTIDSAGLAQEIKAWGRALGFQDVRIADACADMSAAESGMFQWLDKAYHGEMDYMAKHGVKRARPYELVPGAQRVISVRMNYSPPKAADSWLVINQGEKAFISRYALGRDYHKVLRARMQKLADKIQNAIGAFSYRVFSDSAPVMEVEWAQKAGLGWRGKHTLLLSREAGSYFFLGEILTDLLLPIDEPIGTKGSFCGSCTKCIDVCPTQAIVAPFEVDARRCISYLTIELKSSIPEPLRPLIGNRIYGCDDCQLVCPWNKFAQVTEEPDFHVRHGLDDITLVELFRWSAEEFETRLAGSPIRRIGYQQWLRNIAVGLGNAPYAEEIVTALRARLGDPSEMVREHVQWALEQQQLKKP